MTADSAPPALALRGTTVRYGDRVGIERVDLSVARGEFVALTGPNGSGKTTVMRAALGFLPPSEGSVELFGRPVGTLSIRQRARSVAWVPQEESLRDNISLLEYVLYGRYPFHSFLDRETAAERARVRELLHTLALEDRAEDGVLSLSGGERQRAILGRALAQETPLLLLDEPTSHLDIGHQLDLLHRVRVRARSTGVAIVAALHDLNLAARFADRIVVLSRGHRVADGPPTTVLSEDLLARVWGVDADLAVDRRTGLPYLIPRRIASERPRGAPSPFIGPVHVVGGGGAAAPFLRELSERGYRVTAGALHLLDTDAEVADALGVPCAIESPFAPLGEEVRARHRALLAGAKAIVVVPFAVGPSNLANLEDLRSFVAEVPTFLLTRPPIRERDFADGRAQAVYAELVAAGAIEVDDRAALLEGLEREVPRSPAPARAGSPGTA